MADNQSGFDFARNEPRLKAFVQEACSGSVGDGWRFGNGESFVAARLRLVLFAGVKVTLDSHFVGLSK